MSTSDTQSRIGLQILLLALAGSIAGLIWWSFVPASGGQPAALNAEFKPAAGAPRVMSESAEDEPTSRRDRTTLEAFSTTPANESGPTRAPRPGSERALRDQYLALEAAHPGHLALHAQEWVGSERPAAEKVAWLQALQKNDAVAAVPWLEFASSLRDPSSAHGETPAAFALECLSKLSTRDAAARAALGRLVGASGSVDVELRRRAAMQFAAVGNALEIESLSQTLLRENDEILRAGVVVALEARTETEVRLAADRLLAWLSPASASFLAREETDVH